MSAKAASTNGAYRGNEIRILDAKGKLIKVMTIDKFLKERSRPGGWKQQSLSLPKKRRNNDAVFDSHHEPYEVPSDPASDLTEYQQLRRREPAPLEGERNA